MLGNRSKDSSKNFTGKVDSREMSIFNDPNFDEMFSNAIYNSREDVVDAVDAVPALGGFSTEGRGKVACSSERSRALVSWRVEGSRAARRGRGRL